MSDTVSFRIKLTAEDAAKYEALAVERKIPVETVLGAQLARFSAVTSEKPIVFNDDERRAVEKLAKRSVGSAADVVKIIENAVSLECEGVKVPVDPGLLARMRRLTPKKKPFPQFLGEVLTRMLATSQEF